MRARWRRSAAASSLRPRRRTGRLDAVECPRAVECVLDALDDREVGEGLRGRVCRGALGHVRRSDAGGVPALEIVRRREGFRVRKKYNGHQSGVPPERGRPIIDKLADSDDVAPVLSCRRIVCRRGGGGVNRTAASSEINTCAPSSRDPSKKTTSFLAASMPGMRMWISVAMCSCAKSLW